MGPESGRDTLNADEFYAAFVAALDANGLAISGSGRFFRIVDKAKAKGHSIALVEEGATPPHRDEMVTRIIRAQHVELDALRALLSQFVSPGADVVSFPPDVLIVSDLGSNLERLDKLVAAVDVEKKATERLRVIEVHHADVQQVADEVQRVYGPKSPKSTEVLTVTPDERTNRLLVWATPWSMAQVVSLVEQLDLATASDSRAHVYKLVNSEAKEIAANLEPLVSSGRSRATAGAAGAAAVTANEVKISANESMNALVIVASTGDYRTLVEVIKELDGPRRQVFIETVIMEVNAGRDSQLGISGPRGLERGWAAHRPGLRARGSGVVPRPVDPGHQDGADRRYPRREGHGALVALGPQHREVRARHSGRADRLRRERAVDPPHPHHRQQGGGDLRRPAHSLSVGGEPEHPGLLFVTGNASSASTLSSLGTSVTRERVELKLVVKPHIGEGETVRLEVNQQAEELAGENTSGPITSTRAQKTTIVARDDETVVLGGIMQDRIIESVSKTPVLGDIPLLGNLFRFTSKKKVKVNLLVYLTPHLVRRSERRTADSRAQREGAGQGPRAVVRPCPRLRGARRLRPQARPGDGHRPRPHLPGRQTRERRPRRFGRNRPHARPRGEHPNAPRRHRAHELTTGAPVARSGAPEVGRATIHRMTLAVSVPFSRRTTSSFARRWWTRFRGEVRLLVHPALVHSGLLGALSELLRSHGSLRLALRAAAVLEDAVSFDLAMWIGAVSLRSLMLRRLGELRWGLAAAPGYVKARGESLEFPIRQVTVVHPPGWRSSEESRASVHFRR